MTRKKEKWRDKIRRLLTSSQLKVDSSQTPRHVVGVRDGPSIKCSIYIIKMLLYYLTFSWLKMTWLFFRASRWLHYYPYSEQHVSIISPFLSLSQHHKSDVTYIVACLHHLIILALNLTSKFIRWHQNLYWSFYAIRNYKLNSLSSLPLLSLRSVWLFLRIHLYVSSLVLLLSCSLSLAWFL